MKKVLFINRDGALLPKVFRNLYFIRLHLDFDMVIVACQDEADTVAFPQERHNMMIQAFANEEVHFDDTLILSSRYGNPPEKYLSGDYDLAHSFVIGARLTDMELAKKLGCRAILIHDIQLLDERPDLQEICVLATTDWDRITEYLYAGERMAKVARKTKETDVYISLNLDGAGHCDISTGLGFFDHLLQQIGKHSGIDLTIHTKGDLHVDEHHTIEDTAIAFGEALYIALGDKRGIERYGFCLPMDDCLCTVAIDFGGRPWMVWNADYKREKIGDMPTEMFLHFFKSLSDAAKMNLHVKAEGTNEHHKIEGTCKAFARALKMAIRRDINHFDLPTTKGVL